MSISASFTIEYTQFLDKHGKSTQDLPEFAKDNATLISFYKAMVLTRTFDAKAVSLQRTGRLGTYPACVGEEAVSIGLASAMTLDDVLVPYYRQQGAHFWRGIAMETLLLYWGGDERGSVYDPAIKDFPISVPVGTHPPHATGIAHAIKLRAEKRGVVCILGDGGTSQGAFYEALNLAGVWNLPVVFVIINNQWAISVKREIQTAAQTLAQKAIAAGIPGEQVDGNDVIAVHHAVSQALIKARNHSSPHVIEAITYRLGDHTTADDATRYRDPNTVSEHWTEDPIMRLRTYLSSTGAWTKADEEKLLTDCARDVDAAIERYLATPMPTPTDMFDYLFKETPISLAEQRATFLKRLNNDS
jgi:pyruvate dehydrogenase E1 component alpha subunit